MALLSALPLVLTFIIYLVVADGYHTEQLIRELPAYVTTQPAAELETFIEKVKTQALQQNATSTGHALFDAATLRYRELIGTSRLIMLSIGFGGAAICYAIASRCMTDSSAARSMLDYLITSTLFLSAAIAIFCTIGIIMSLAIETVRFFTIPNGPTLVQFFFGTSWDAQSGENGASFGAVPLFFGTIFIAFIALLVAAPIGLFAAIYLSEYASSNVRQAIKPTLETLAGIPTVIYGFFAAGFVAPMVRNFALWINSLPFTPDNFLAAQPTGALAAGLVMGIMIIPYISSLVDDAINAVPQSLREGALAMGSTPSEMLKTVILPAAFPGIAAAFLLAISRAIGETMIVVMAVGTAAKLTANPFESVTTVTVQMTTLLIGDHEFDSAKTLAAFALGLVLFVITLVLNFYALRIVKKYREQYD